MRVKRTAYRPLEELDVIVLNPYRREDVKLGNIIKELKNYLTKEFPDVKFSIRNRDNYIWVESKMFAKDNHRFTYAVSEMLKGEFGLMAEVGIGSWK